MIIHKSDTLFIACCMHKMHSFIVIGAQRQQGECLFLLEVGKAIPHEYRHMGMLHTLWLLARNKIRADIMNERKLVHTRLDNKERAVTYTAYEITLTDYQELLSVLKSQNSELDGYIPVDEDETTITFQYQSLASYQPIAIQASDIVDRLQLDMHTLSLRSNCRNTAVDMASLHLPHTADVSQTLPLNPVQRFLCDNIMHQHRMKAPLFILPQPPDATILPPYLYQLQATIFQRMINLLENHQDSTNTQAKFASIKRLYTDLAAKPAQSLASALSTISDWETRHQALINTHRGLHFFSQKTKTKAMVDSLLQYNLR